jgi:hypothetical protein
MLEKGMKVTQGEVEQVARGIRAKMMHSSWDELVEFAESVVGNLVDAYQVLLKNSVLSDNTSSIDHGDLRKLTEGKLSKVLISLTSLEQVAKWRSEAITA